MSLFFLEKSIFILLKIIRAEMTLGKILKKKKWKRSTYIVSTKLYWGGK